ncbi:MAG: MFS transporter [Syntrophobacteraceae bacterium]
MNTDVAATTKITTQTVWGYRHVILLVVWVLYLINYFDRISVLTFLPYIQKDLNLSPVEVGWLGSVFFFGYALAQFSAGYLADRIGPKKTMNIAILVFTIVTFVTGFVRNLGQFLALRIGLALGEGHHYAPAVRMITNWFPKDERARANATFATTWAVAPAIVPFIVTWTAAEFFDGAWRPIFFILAVPGVIGTFLLWRFLSDSPREMHKRGKVQSAEYDLITSSVGGEADEKAKKTYSSKMFMTDVQFYLYTAVFFITLMIYWGTTTWISTFLVKQHGLNLKTMGIYASIPYLVAICSMYLGGWMADKLFRGRPRFVMTLSFLGCVPALLFIGHVSRGETGLLLLGLALVGFFSNLAWGMINAYPSFRYPKELVGRSLGVANGIGQMGAFLSPLIAGYLVIELPDKSFDFSNVFVFWSISALVGAIAAALLNEKSVVDHEKFSREGR